MNVGLSPISTFRARAGHFRSTAKSGHYIAAQYRDGPSAEVNGVARGAAKGAVQARYGFFCAKIHDTERDRQMRRGRYMRREV